MARTQSSKNALFRQLADAARPIYLIDAERRIVWCNSALAAWTGVEADQLTGFRCDYHSEALSDNAPAAADEQAPIFIPVEEGASLSIALSPPPTAFDGERSAGVVACRDGERTFQRRRAEFIPLGKADDGVIVLVDEHDLIGDDASQRDDDECESAELHAQLLAFRAEAAAAFQIDHLVGRSPAIRRARAQARLAAESGANVLIAGPGGSGREELARAIHYAAPNAEAGSLTPIDCAVLNSQLLQEAIAGLLRRASKTRGAGSDALLLTEVDRLSAEAQALLTNVLYLDHAELRVLATTSRPLTDLSRCGEFRPELAQHLSTLVIELPALRERKADIPLLAQWRLEKLNASAAEQRSGFTAEALDRLAAYDWPGDVAQLARVVAEAGKSAEGAKIQVEDLPTTVRGVLETAAHPNRDSEPIELDAFLAQVERELLQRAIRRSKGNKAQAARLLGVSRPRLLRRMEQLGVEK